MFATRLPIKYKRIEDTIKNPHASIQKSNTLHLHTSSWYTQNKTSTEINGNVPCCHNNWREVARCHYHGIIVSVSTTASLIIGGDWWQIEGSGASVGDLAFARAGGRCVARFPGAWYGRHHAWSWRKHLAAVNCPYRSGGCRPTANREMAGSSSSTALHDGRERLP